MIDLIATVVLAFLVLGMYLCVGVLASIALRDGCGVKGRPAVAALSLLWPIGLVLVAVLAIIFGGDE